MAHRNAPSSTIALEHCKDVKESGREWLSVMGWQVTGFFIFFQSLQGSTLGTDFQIRTSYLDEAVFVNR